MKKQLRATTAAMLATSTVLVALPVKEALAVSYKDVTPDTDFYVALQALTSEGIITGYADGTFKPNAKITRGQLAKILTRLLKLTATQKTQFSDISAEHDFYSYANAVVEAGFMTKQNGKFNASQTISRNEYAQVLAKAFKLKSSGKKLPFVDAKESYKAAIQAVYENGIMKGVSSVRFNGTGEVKRSQLVLTLHRAMEMQKREQVQTSPTSKTTKLTIALAGATTIYTDDDEKYTVPVELQKLFNTANNSVLTDAEIEAVVEKGKIIEVKKLTLMQNTYIGRTLDGQGGTYSFPIIVESNNVELKNMTLPNVITGADASGTLTLQKVTLKQGLTIEYGYSRSYIVTVEGSQLGEIEIQRDRVTLNSTTKLPRLFVSEDSYDLTLNAAVGQLQFERDGYFTLYGNGTIDTLNVYRDARLYIRNTGLIKKLVIENSGAFISLDSNSNIVQAIIPANTTFSELFAYPYNLKYYIQKISYPNNPKNLLADEVVKPSKEQLALNRAIENVIRSHKHSVATNTLTIRTEFNEVLPAMKSMYFEERIYLSGSAPDNSTIPVTLFKGGQMIGTRSIVVADFKNGISLQTLFGDPKSFEKFTTNSSTTYAIRFETNRELKIRSTVFVGGTAKNSEETSVNTGNKTQIDAALRTTVKSYQSVMGNDNTLTTDLALNKIDDAVKDLHVNHFIKLHSDVKELTQIPLIIRKNGREIYRGNIAVADLKQGILTSRFMSMTADPLSQFSDNSIAQYTFEFDTTKELIVSASLYIEGVQFKEGEQVKLNEGVEEEAFDKLEINATADLKSADSLQFTFKKLATISKAVENLPLDVMLKLTEGAITPGESVKFEITVKGNKRMAEIPVEKLKAGANVLAYITRDNDYKAFSVKDLTEDQVVNIKLVSAFKGKLTASSIVNDVAKGTTATPNTFDVMFTETLDSTSQRKEGQTILEEQKIIDSFTVDAYKNGFEIKTKFGEDAPKAASTTKIDAEIRVKNGLSLKEADKNKVIYMTIFFDEHLVKQYVPVTYEDLLEGKYLSAIIGQDAATLSSHASGREDSWKIIVHGHNQPVDIDVTIFEIIGLGNANPIATAYNTFNADVAKRFEKLVSSFTFKKQNNVYTLDANFTSTANVNEQLTTSFIVRPYNLQQARNPIDIKVSRIEGNKSIEADNVIQLVGDSFDAGISTSDIILKGQDATKKPTYAFLKNLSAAPSKWKIEYSAVPTKMQAHFVVNDYIVKTVDETTN